MENRAARSQLDRLGDASGSHHALAMLVSSTGSTPKKAGAKMFIDASGAVSGTVTIGGCVDARITQAAAQALAGAPATLLDISLGEEEAWELGLTCGGAVSVIVQVVDAGTRAAYATARWELAGGHAVVVATWLSPKPRRVVITEAAIANADVEVDARLSAAARRVFESGVSLRVAGVDVGESVDVFLEYLTPPKQLVIVGAGEIARSLVPMAHELGMETIVVDARDRFASRSRFPLADTVRVGIPSEIVATLPKSARTAIILVAHDYKFELPILRDTLRSAVGYIGMLGGTRRGATIRQMLAEEGFTPEELARLHSPIGVDIGARSTAEIALAIVAELVSLERVTR